MPRYWLLALYSTLRYIRYALLTDQSLWIHMVKRYILVNQMVQEWMVRANALMRVISTQKGRIVLWKIFLNLRPWMI